VNFNQTQLAPKGHSKKFGGKKFKGGGVMVWYEPSYRWV